MFGCIPQRRFVRGFQQSLLFAVNLLFFTRAHAECAQKECTSKKMLGEHAARFQELTSKQDYKQALPEALVLSECCSCAQTWYNLGRTQQRLGQWSDAETAYQKAQSFAPSDAQLRDKIQEGLDAVAAERVRVSSPQKGRTPKPPASNAAPAQPPDVPSPEPSPWFAPINVLHQSQRQAQEQTQAQSQNVHLRVQKSSWPIYLGLGAGASALIIALGAGLGVPRLPKDAPVFVERTSGLIVRFELGGR